MSCGLSIEKLRDFDRQLDEQSNSYANQIQQLETQLATAKNSYLKVLGAKEIVNIQIQEAEQSKQAVAEVVPEASGD
tara:strand:- start:9157 stop:9387 length:231 start_codon:yes stop_codon:yes gene_type:complete